MKSNKRKWGGLSLSFVALAVGMSTTAMAADTASYSSWNLYSENPGAYAAYNLPPNTPNGAFISENPLTLQKNGAFSGLSVIIYLNHGALPLIIPVDVNAYLSNIIASPLPTNQTTCGSYMTNVVNTSIAEDLADKEFVLVYKFLPVGLDRRPARLTFIKTSSSSPFMISAIANHGADKSVIETVPISNELQKYEILRFECITNNGSSILVRPEIRMDGTISGQFTQLGGISDLVSLRFTPVKTNATTPLFVGRPYIESEPVQLPGSPPTANAGVDQSAAEGTSVQLDGSASADADGDALTYSWVQTGLAAGEVPLPLVNANTATPSFTAPNVPLGGKTLTFLLTVTANGVSSTDEVNVTITNINHVPVAEAGPDQQVSEGALVTLDGTASFDADGDALTYTWVQTDGTRVTLSDEHAIRPTFIAPMIEGGDPQVTDPLTFALTVEDNNPADAPAPGYTTGNQSDSVVVTVTNTNNLPIANAGQDITVNEHGEVTLNGLASSDPDGDTLTYNWVQTSGPAIVLANEGTAAPSFTAPYVSAGGADIGVMLTVSDPFGGSAMAPVTVHVQNENDPPLASAARPSVSEVWPPDHRLVPVSILGVSDPNDNARITINSVTQDEPTNGLGDGDTAVDAVINPDGTVLLRAERSGKGDGRVYTIHFTAADDEGSDSGSVKVSVPKNAKSPAVDSGQQFDSTQ